MKRILTLLTFLCVISGSVLAQNFREHDGWEFLNWKSSKSKVDKILEQNKDKITEATALDADFKYQDMNTWLVYNKANKLIEVNQRKEFSVIYHDEAEAFYQKFKKQLISSYGEPDSLADNKADSTIHLTWRLKYTNIFLEYDYRYKIIDEFGAGSYWVDVIFAAVKNE